MNEQNFEAWLKALESDEYPQGQGQLFSLAGGLNQTAGYCCLGLGCEVAGPTVVEDWRDLSLAPYEFIEWLGIPIEDGIYDEQTGVYDIATLDGDPNISAAGLNDKGVSFKDIAKWLRQNKRSLLAVGG